MDVSLMLIIFRKIKPNSIVYIDSYSAYNALDVSRFHHERINHSVAFAKGKTTSTVLKAFVTGPNEF